MVKMKRTHVTIKEDQILRIIKFLNRSNDMVSYIRDPHAGRLSDVRRLEDGMCELADMGGLRRQGDMFIKCYDDIDLTDWESIKQHCWSGVYEKN